VSIQIFRNEWDEFSFRAVVLNTGVNFVPSFRWGGAILAGERGGSSDRVRGAKHSRHAEEFILAVDTLGNKWLPKQQ